MTAVFVEIFNMQIYVPKCLSPYLLMTSVNTSQKHELCKGNTVLGRLKFEFL